jgi:hypothetical protein
MWFVGPRTKANVGNYLYQILCWYWIKTRRRNPPLGNGLQKAQRQRAWFSEPPNKELEEYGFVMKMAIQSLPFQPRRVSPRIHKGHSTYTF